MSQWIDKHSMGKVLYDFEANGQFQISVKTGEMVEVMKMSSGWYKGRVIGRPAKGIFPVSFVELTNDPIPSDAQPTLSPMASPPASPAAAPRPLSLHQQPAVASSRPESKQPPPVTNTPTTSSSSSATPPPATSAPGANTVTSPFGARKQWPPGPPGGTTNGTAAAPSTSTAPPPSNGVASRFNPPSGSPNGTPSSSPSVLNRFQPPKAASASASAAAPAESTPPPAAAAATTPPAATPPPVTTSTAATPPPVTTTVNASAPIPTSTPTPAAARFGPPKVGPPAGPPPPSAYNHPAAAPPPASAASAPGAASPPPPSSSGKFPPPGRAGPPSSPPPISSSNTATSPTPPSSSPPATPPTRALPQLSPTNTAAGANSANRWGGVATPFATPGALPSQPASATFSPPPPLNTTLPSVKPPTGSPNSQSRTITPASTIRYDTSGRILPALSPTSDARRLDDDGKESYVSEVESRFKQDMSVDALFNEIVHTMKDWDHSLKQALATGNVIEYHRALERMSALLELRRKLHVFADDGAGSEQARLQAKNDIIQLIESSRKMQEGYMVPRNDQGVLADTINTGVIELLRLHRVMYSTLKEESSHLWMQKAEMRRLTSLKKQNSSRMPNVKGMLDPTTMMPTKQYVFPQGPLQLYMDIKMCIFSVGEATELYFALYSATEKQFLTEDYYLALTDQGMPVNLKLLGKMRTIFADLTEKDFLERDIYLVCRIYRQGRLVFDPKKKKAPNRTFRRPFGCAATSLSQASLETQLGKEYQPPNAAMTIYTPTVESTFAKLHEKIIARDRDLEPAPRAKGIALGFVLHAGDVDTLRKADPVNLNAEDVPLTHKLSFPEVMDPGNHRNDFYCYLLGGSFSQDSKKSAKNIEVTIRVCDERGTTIDNAICMGSGDGAILSEYRTAVYYHQNSPTFCENIKIQLPAEIFEKCHLLFTFWHVSTSATGKTAPFAFSFLRLCSESGSVIVDGEKQMSTFKPFPKIELKEANNGFYLNPAESAKLVGRKELFTVRSTLCSTKKTQNPVLHCLFKWRTTDVYSLNAHLEKFQQFNSNSLAEMAKFVRETFDMFFSILGSDKHQLAHENVFKATLHALSLLTDKKASSAYRDLVDTYIARIFKDATVHQVLLNLCSKRLQESKKTPDESLMRLTKCLNYVFKFIIASRQLDVNSANPSSAANFKQAVQQVLGHVNLLVAAEEKEGGDRYLLPSQSYLVRSFPESIQDLSGIFDASELGAITRGMITAIPAVPNQNVNKLNLIRNLLMGPIGEVAESRAIVFPVVISALQTHLRAIDTLSLSEPYLCFSILSNMLQIMQSKENFSEDKMWEFNAVLPDVVHACLLIQQSQLGEVVLKQPNDTVLASCKIDINVDSVTVLWTLLQNFNDSMLDRFLASMQPIQFQQFAGDLVQVCHNSLRLPLYPELWIVMNMLQLSIIGKVLNRLSDPIIQRCLPPSSQEMTFNIHLIWKQYFELSLALLLIDPLYLEKFSERKRQFIMSRYGDIRSPIIQQTRMMWEALGSHKLMFCEVLIAKLFELAANGAFEAQQLALDLYYNMVCHEYSTTVGNAQAERFPQVERHTIDALYNLANQSQETGTKLMQLLYRSLSAQFSATGGDLAKDGTEFLNHVQRMYELMSSLLKFPDTALFEDERTSVALKLMNYLETSGHVRKEMYTRYVQYLVDLHAGLKNYVEAGMTQLLQIRMLEWTDALLAPHQSFPLEKERDRRERLFKSAIKFFTAGEEWERAIERCDELREYYQNEVYDYDKLSGILVEQADFFKQIVHTERFYSNYFRVIYYGDFDPEIKEKEYIYRGVKLEPVMDFTNRIKKKYPEAKLWMSSDRPTEEMFRENAQIISITTLTRATEPERDEWYRSNGPIKSNPSSPRSNVEEERKKRELREKQKSNRFVPRQVSTYRENNDVQIFTYSKAIQKSPEKKPANEFKHLWVVKTFIVAEESFPTTRRRLEVKDRKETMLSPIENAIATILNKNVELREKIEQVRLAPQGPVDVGPLSMNLNGMIDAAVNGGTQKYIEAFLTNEFLQENRDAQSQEQQKVLRQALKDQTEMLRSGLSVFGARCDVKLKGLFDHLSGFFDQMVTKMSSSGIL